ncbi:hypothetical protein ACWE42_16720 [Sutcliffiella cohnii]
MENAISKFTRAMPYIPLEDLDFMWSLQEVLEFDKFWKYGIMHKKSPVDMIQEAAEYFGRDEDEIAILAMCRKRKGKI